MLILGGLARIGLDVQSAVRVVGVMSHVGTVIFLYLVLRKVNDAYIWVAFLAAAYLAAGPGLYYAAAYFGTPFFAFLACITWWLAVRVVMGAEVRHASLWFSISSLVLGLTRPEGVFLAGLMLLWIVSRRGLKESVFTIGLFLAVFSVCGTLFLVWRWSYFGQVLPNPYLKKGGGHFSWQNMVLSFRSGLLLALPLVPLWLTGLRSRLTTMDALASLIPIGGFLAIWGLISEDMSFLFRYQYPVLPIILLAWPPLTTGLQSDWHFPRIATLDRRNQMALIATMGVIGLIACAYISVISARNFRNYYPRDGRHDVAVSLSRFAGEGYSMAITEAGLLPFYSKWRALDAWGLNDQWIAGHGLITEDYLARFKPNVIMFAAPFSPLIEPHDAGLSENSVSHSRNWYDMVTILKAYAEKHNYRLAASFGVSPFYTHYYYVRPDFPHSEPIFESIKNMDYRMDRDTPKAFNYANGLNVPR